MKQNNEKTSKYTDSNGQQQYPYIIHRTSLGCYERTIAYLLEKFAGALPLWLSPEQIRILPIGDDQAEYAENVRKTLAKAGLRVKCDTRNEKIGYKIRAAQLDKVPYMLVIGEKEMTSDSVAVRERGTGDIGVMTVSEFMARALEENNNKVIK